MFDNFIIKYWEGGRIKIERLALNRIGALTPGDCRWWKFKVKVSTHFVKEESVSPAGAKDQKRGVLERMQDRLEKEEREPHRPKKEGAVMREFW